ncbi:1,2-phenylacetyl-CoA epoxidase subunit PaaE [Nocardiopsis rhodophaea]|uniref:1,2-phenylacetyl-CoA epoxidase subunit PaaE n=1 Tax=Nocardiopsis rhodophaea TaxID=280238 RepID=UPI0031E47538
MNTEVSERPAAARTRGVFHPLTVAAVDRLTDDAVAITFDVPEELAEEFRFVQGQHLTIRCEIDGRELRRNYSICSPAPDGPLRIAVKRLEDGSFSAYANERLRPGDVLDVMHPMGGFHVPLTPDRARVHAAVAAGSGITPVLSIITTTLAAEPSSTFTLVYANRTARDVMFLEELQDVKDRYPQRFQLVNVLSREVGESPLSSGRIDADKLDLLFTRLIAPDEVDHWYLCGPAELVRLVRDGLRARGIRGDRVHYELFHAEDEQPLPRRRHTEGGGAAAATSHVRFTLDGRTTTVDVDPDAETVLAAALRVRDDAPYACRGGVCGTCRAKLREGEVDMARNYALEPDELADGYVLTCQSRPLTENVVVDYDA